MRTLMAQRECRLYVIVIALSVLTLTGFAQERDRSKVADKYKWNLADLYPTDAAWRAQKDRLASELPKLRASKGKLAGSAATLAEALETMSVLEKDLSRLYTYAMLLADQDGERTFKDLDPEDDAPSASPATTEVKL